jgi:hypothetical protein
MDCVEDDEGRIFSSNREEDEFLSGDEDVVTESLDTASGMEVSPVPTALTSTGTSGASV